jgi:hypothetical protein
MKNITIKSLKEFQDLITKSYSNDTYFRGQSDSDWQIIPSIARNKNIKTKCNLLKTENKLNGEFLKKIEEFGAFYPEHSYHKSWWIIMAGQHSGLPTRLLDFTHDIYTAISFAVNFKDSFCKDGQLIIHENSKELQLKPDSTILLNPFSQYCETFFMQAPAFYSEKDNPLINAEKRKIIQGSKFLYLKTETLRFCISQNQLMSDGLTIIKIPQKLKIEIAHWLLETDKMIRDPYKGVNYLDYYASELKCGFNKLNDFKIIKSKSEFFF